jgi:hypothetical protein
MGGRVGGSTAGDRDWRGQGCCRQYLKRRVTVNPIEEHGGAIAIARKQKACRFWELYLNKIEQE